MAAPVAQTAGWTSLANITPAPFPAPALFSAPAQVPDPTAPVPVPTAPAPNRRVPRLQHPPLTSVVSVGRRGWTQRTPALCHAAMAAPVAQTAGWTSLANITPRCDQNVAEHQKQSKLKCEERYIFQSHHLLECYQISRVALASKCITPDYGSHRRKPGKISGNAFFCWLLLWIVAP